MANRRIDQLTNICAPCVASGDEFAIYDADAATTKAIVPAELAKALNKQSAYTTKTSAYVATALDEYIFACTGCTGAFTITIPNASTVPGKKYTIQKTDACLNKLTIDPACCGTIYGTTCIFLLGYNESVDLVSDGCSWIVTKWDCGEDIVTTNNWSQTCNICINQLTIRFARETLIVKESITTWTGTAGTGVSAEWDLPGSLLIDTTRRFGGGTSSLNHEANKYGDATIFTTAWVAVGIFYYTSNSVRFSGGGATFLYTNLTASDSIRFTPGVEIPIA